jgi:spore germination protein YaaH
MGGLTSGGEAAGGIGGNTSQPELRRVGYLRGRGKLSTWKDRLDFSLLTHVVLAFASVDAQGNLSYTDGGLADFVTAAQARGVAVCVALGGGGTNGGLGTLAGLISAGGRGAFIQKILDYAKAERLGCIDVDFEGPGVNDDYAGFVTDLGAALRGQGLKLSAAVASWYGSRVSNDALAAFDFVNIMAYDLHNPAGTTTPVPGSALDDSKKEIEYWVDRGLDASKAVLGVPFYGYRWTTPGSKGQAVTYADILSTYGAGAATTDEIKQGGATVYYDGTDTVGAKVTLAKQYGGTMIWELSQDAAGDASLLRAMHAAD